MKQKLIVLSLLLTVIAYKNNHVSAQVKLAGKYLLIKHTLKEGTKVSDILTADYIYTYDFNKDGTYKATFDDRHNGAVTVNTGKWKFINKGKTFKLYDIKAVPADEYMRNDQSLPVVSFTASQLVVKEYLFGEDLLGTSYYKKQ